MLSSTPVSPSFGALSEGAEHFFAADRRKQAISELEVAATILRRAAYYLINEQVNERCISAHATHDAIRLLAHAGRQIVLEERRMPAKRSIRAWLRKVLFKAQTPERRGENSNRPRSRP